MHWPMTRSPGSCLQRCSIQDDGLRDSSCQPDAAQK